MKSIKYIVLIMLTVVVQACTLVQKPQLSPTTTQSPPVATITLTPSIQPSSITPTETPTITITPLPTFPLVTITAVNGDLAIRSGPDMTFTAIGKLRKGTTAQVIARSILIGWVQIPITADPLKTGWVSIQTNYSKVDGNISDLPVIKIVEWPNGSYLRNCTGHQLIVTPGDTLLPPVTDAPNNRVWFAPGSYVISDMDVPGQPMVKEIRLTPRIEVDLRKDGDGKLWECP